MRTVAVEAKAIPESSLLWDELLSESPAWLHDETSKMQKAQRLSAAAERCVLQGEDATANETEPDISLMNFSAQLAGRSPLSISAVDKRSTAIVTPLLGWCLSVLREAVQCDELDP
eukprot:Skav227507  [mRNA]  locus=scaffold282:266546:268748:+ [translate_table: standard]